MSHRKKNPPRSGIVLFSLAVYLSVWIGSAQGLSLVSMLMDGSHQTFLTTKNDQTRLIFHHSGYQDEHEFPGHPANDPAGPADLESGRGDSPDPDHVFYLPDHEQQTTPTSTAKTTPAFKILFPSTELEGLTLVQPVSARPSPPPLFKISTTLLSLRATVLLI